MDNRTIEEVRENETRLINELLLLEENNNKLKKIIKVNEKSRREMQQSFMTTIDSQQREKNEFIEYLESEINILKIIFDSEQDEDNRYHVLIRKSLLQRILSEYKEITNSNDEN